MERSLSKRTIGVWGPICLAVVMWPGNGWAQETDVTQTPNAINAGIKKSFQQQIGAGRGTVDRADSSLYIINRDPFRSIRRGRNLFQRKFTLAQGQGPRTGDGGGGYRNRRIHRRRVGR